MFRPHSKLKLVNFQCIRGISVSFIYLKCKQNRKLIIKLKEIYIAMQFIKVFRVCLVYSSIMYSTKTNFMIKQFI